MSFNITFMEYGSNDKILEEQLDHIPAIGDFVILNDKITSNWNKQMYMVMSVTHLLDNSVVLHIEQYDPEERAKKHADIKEKLDALQGRMKKAEEIVNATNI